MKIQYLGTAASEGIPAIYCQCKVCKKARALGGKNIMSRSQALIDDTVLIDYPADTYWHSMRQGIDLTNIKTLLITHDHGDHLYPLEIANKRPGYAKYEGEIIPLSIYCTGPAYEKLNAVMESRGMKENSGVYLNLITPFMPFEAERYKITPLKAAHAPQCEPVIYMLEKDGKAMLYAHDSGTFPEETLEYMRNSGVKFDYVSLDCTFSLLHYSGGGVHMCIDENERVKNDMLKMGLADENTVFTANHFTHNGGGCYDDFKPELDKIGFLTSYDGFTVEF